MDNETLVTLTADIVAAHVSNNNVPISDVGTLVERVHSALAALGAPTETVPDKPQPRVSVRASVRPDHLVCLVCGARQKTLKRHLAVAHELTPQTYRDRFGLRSDYPMVAPDYSNARREMAYKIGLGQKRRGAKSRSAREPAKPARTSTAKAKS